MNTKAARRVLTIAGVALIAGACASVRSSGDDKTTAAITPADLRKRIYIFADDSMRGRAAGTIDNHRGNAYIESELKRLGVEAAGENGSYFQDVALTARQGIPGRNVIAVIRGSDPSLRGQYVALGAHNDHDPVRPYAVDHDSLRAHNIVARVGGAESRETQITPAQATRIRAIRDSLRSIRPPRLDSIMNGADDDGSGSMALLEIAESFARAKVKPKRSILFIWHTAEELGLLGAEYFTEHPTVPRDSIVAQLNIDMIGRGGSADAVHETDGKPVYGNPDFVEVIGARRLSTELGDIVDAANAAQARPLQFSLAFDANGDRHQMYCRSDHYMYARYGIPITFFFTSVHHDYHQPTDEPQYLDYAKYSRIVNLVRDITDRVANLDHRLVVDKPKPNPHASCVQ